MAAFILWISWHGAWLHSFYGLAGLVRGYLRRKPGSSLFFCLSQFWFGSPFLIPSLLYFLCPAANKGYRMQVYHSYITMNLSNTFHPVRAVISFQEKDMLEKKTFPNSIS